MKEKLKNSLNRVPQIVKYLLVFAVVVFISFLFPNNTKFKYEFEVGQTWRYDDLHAPFAFPIKKTEKEIQSAIANLEKEFTPIYQFNGEVVKQKRASFQRAFNLKWEAEKENGQYKDVVLNPGIYLEYGKRFLTNWYEKGIIELAPEHKGQSNDYVLTVVRGNTNTNYTLQTLWEEKKAKERLPDSLFYSGLQEAEFILNILDTLIKSNIFYSDSLTQRQKDLLLGQMVTTRGAVEKGDLIVLKDGVITPEINQILLSFKSEYENQITEKKSHIGVFIGYFLLTSLILGVFLMYLMTFAEKIFQKITNLIFILIWLVAYSYLVHAVEQSDTLSSYLIPFCIVPIVIKHFFTDRLAFFTHIVVVLIASFLSSLGYEFTFIQILAGIVAVLAIADAHHWNKFFLSVLYIFLTYAGAFLGLSLIKEGSINVVDWNIYIWIFLNVFLTLLAFPLISLIEKVFGFTSSITLVELSDMTRSLLRDLALKAPGTLQHSLQVANLSEAAANEIGADPLLVKVGALYHDIGKMENPSYFIENQSGRNPHEEINNLESAKIIIGHVTEGIKMGKKHRLPQALIDLIQTHHGTTRVEYFYRNHCKENPDKEFDETLFCYPGPRPKTKEETILMIADSLEAAAKSIKNPTGKDIDEMVDKIVAYKIEMRQLEESEMTFEELERCKIVFKLLLRSINHVRVEYPAEVKNKN